MYNKYNIQHGICFKSSPLYRFFYRLGFGVDATMAMGNERVCSLTQIHTELLWTVTAMAAAAAAELAAAAAIPAAAAATAPGQKEERCIKFQFSSFVVDTDESRMVHSNRDRAMPEWNEKGYFQNEWKTQFNKAVCVMWAFHFCCICALSISSCFTLASIGCSLRLTFEQNAKWAHTFSIGFLFFFLGSNDFISDDSQFVWNENLIHRIPVSVENIASIAGVNINMTIHNHGNTIIEFEILFLCQAN